MIFDGWRMPLQRAGRAPVSLEEVQAHYAALATRLGVPVPPPEGVVNGLGYLYLRAGDTARAVAVFRANADAWPDSPNVHDSLGEALERAGQGDAALASYERA